MEPSTEINEGNLQKVACRLYLNLSRFFMGKTSYNAENGLRQSFVLLGRINDPFRYSNGDIDELSGKGDSAFHGKPVRIEVWSSLELKAMESAASNCGVDSGFGKAEVSAGVEEVEITMHVPQNVFEVFRREAAEAHAHNHIMNARVSLLLGVSLDNVSIFDGLNKVQWSLPKDIDVSQDRLYILGDFEMFETGDMIDDMRGRVRRIRPEGEGKYGEILSFLITNAGWEVDVEEGKIQEIFCQGSIRNVLSPFNGASAFISFLEYEPNRHTGKLPEEALFGEFTYDENDNSFRFYLNYLPEDVKGYIIAFLNGDSKTQLSLEIEILSTKDELKNTENDIKKVRGYSFQVSRDFLVTDRREDVVEK